MKPAKLTLGVTPVIYITAMITFLGWFFFCIFGGIGLAALPLDLFSDYANRPVRIDLEEYAKQKMLLNERTVKLLVRARAARLLEWRSLCHATACLVAPCACGRVLASALKGVATH